MAMTDNEVKTMSDLVVETEEAVKVSKLLHEMLVGEVKKLRASQPEIDTHLVESEEG